MADVRAGVGEALAGIGLRVYSESVPEKVSVPAVVIGEGDIRYGDDFDGDDTIEFGVLLLVARADSRTGQALLGEYRQRHGSLSIPSALEADPQLAFQGVDTVDSVRVTGSSAPQTVEIAGVSYLATEFSVEVLVA
jgi:hypothetical protein